MNVKKIGWRRLRTPRRRACALLRYMGFPAVFLLTACAPLLNPPSATPERFDLGLGNVETATPARPISFELRAAPALDTTAMRYRLNYADPTKVMEYSRARWAGTASEILEQYLKSHLQQANPRHPNTKHCRFDLELLRFEQVFTSVKESHATLIVRSRLQSPGQGVLDESNLELTAPAATPDASGGVRALALAADLLTRELRERFAAQGCQN
ncbi:lipoprotein [Betaproteobacteria bacterium]|nr:lipoprotein [Betaproteobacteria bacterium]GHU14570.1 lipoprotein [Betaproteobacteria bacterium]